MVQGPSITALEALRDASASIDEHIAILRQLKNDIAGHRQRKELVVKQGAVYPVVRVIESASRNGSNAGASGGHGWSKEDEARLQATLVLGSLANGGVVFMQPLKAGGTEECLLSTFGPPQHPKLLIATLQALRGLAEQSRTNLRMDSPLRAKTIDNRTLAVFAQILQQQQRPPQWRQLFHLTTDIITAAAVDEDTRNMLLESDVWTALIDMFVKGTISHLPPAREAGKVDTALKNDLPRVMSTIAAIVEGSSYRVERFVHNGLMRGFLCGWVMEYVTQLLPQIAVAPPKSNSFSNGSLSFPALGSLQSSVPTRAGPAFSAAQPNLDINHLQNVCMLLLALLKLVPSENSLPVLRLLAAVNNAIDAHKYLAPQTLDQRQKALERDRYIALCAVPVAIQLVQTACSKNGVDDKSPSELQDHRELKPEACSVLASLIKGSKDLQVAAVEAGAIKRICPVLKKSFDNVTPAKPMWSAKRPKPGDDDDVPAWSKLGKEGLPAEVDYIMRCRRGALEAVAAIANQEDVHRQAIVQAGVVTCIIDSLKPFAADTFEKTGKNGPSISPKDGNTTEVIIAACHAAQSMSRSVSLLRTSLIDAGIAKPIFELLKHPFLDVRVAATEVCCNLVLEFSPMREDLLSAGVIKTLTEHARQSEMALRLSSLWALKHLVLSGTRDVKIQTLEELGVGWLVAAVQGQQRADAQDSANGGVIVNASGGLSAPNAAGERVDLLNPSSMDVDDPTTHNADEEDGEVMYDEASLTHYRASHLRSTRDQTFDSQRYLSYLHDLDHNPALRARQNDVAVQEQGLDFIRNMLNGDECAYMLEHLLSQIGTTQLFSILTEKLAPLTPSSLNTQRAIYHPTELILSTIHVLTHIANGSPPQKQLLIAQRPLLSAWLPHFNHADRRVRCVSVWAVNSLLWVEDESDRVQAVQRVRRLRECGIVGAVEGLRGDGDVDVRERVRVALGGVGGLS